MENERFKRSFKYEERALTSLAVYNTGMQQCEGGYTWGPGIRDHFLVHYIQEGKGTYMVRGETYALTKGDLFLSFPGETIQYSADIEQPWKYCWVGFNGMEAKALLLKTELSQECPVKHCGETIAPYQCLMDIYNARGSNAYESLRMTGRLYLLLAWLQEQGHGIVRKKEQFGVEHVRRACAFIANNFASPITVEDVAGHVGVCRSRLYRAFRDHMDISPAQYITQFRMQQACLLLEKTPLSMKAIAYSVGYEDPLYFSRRFKETFGISPTGYEQRIHQQKE